MSIWNPKEELPFKLSESTRFRSAFSVSSSRCVAVLWNPEAPGGSRALNCVCRASSEALTGSGKCGEFVVWDARMQATSTAQTLEWDSDFLLFLGEAAQRQAATSGYRRSQNIYKY